MVSSRERLEEDVAMNEEAVEKAQLCVRARERACVFVCLCLSLCLCVSLCVSVCMCVWAPPVLIHAQ